MAYFCKLTYSRFLMVALSLLWLLTGCGGDGDTGPQGPVGPPGPPGPPPPKTTSIITEVMYSQVTGASIDAQGAVTVNFDLSDQYGQGFVGLSTSNIRFTLAQLIPPRVTGPGDSSRWQSYINRVEAPPTSPDKGTGTLEQVQATSERNGELSDHGDGSYSYRFNTRVSAVTAPVPVTYQSDYTHRVAYQISGGDYPVLNRSYDWQPSTGATNNILTRNIVVEGTCNACHGKLAIHGGGRVDTAYCVTCHNPGTTDANSGNNLDFSVMVHKIHRGADLPSVNAGSPYVIWGFRDSKHDYSSVHFPQDIRHCTSCHDDNIAATPDAINWQTAPSMEACGACHDDIDFSLAASAPNGHSGGAMSDNGECALCHGPGRFASSEQAHLGVLAAKQAARHKVSVDVQAVRVTPASGDIEVDVNLSLDGAPVAALFDENGNETAAAAVLGRYRNVENGALAINWDKGRGFELNHKEVKFNDCTADGGGLFRCLAPGLLAGISPDDLIATTSVDLLLCINEKSGAIARCDTPPSDSVRIAQVDVAPQTAYFTGDGAPTQAQYSRIGASLENCQTCHKDNQFHHGATDLMQCKTCHNATRAASRGRPGDLKHHVHRYHSGIDDDILTPLEVGDSDNYPNTIADCQACHLPSQIDLPVKQNPRAAAANRGAVVYISATAVVCGSCHLSAPLGEIDPDKPGYTEEGSLSPAHQAVVDHMLQNGAVFHADSFSQANKVESCAVCHGIGSEFAVDKVHRFAHR